jgi:hypothetical protein
MLCILTCMGVILAWKEMEDRGYRYNHADQNLSFLHVSSLMSNIKLYPQCTLPAPIKIHRAGG